MKKTDEKQVDVERSNWRRRGGRGGRASSKVIVLSLHDSMVTKWHKVGKLQLFNTQTVTISVAVVSHLATTRSSIRPSVSVNAKAVRWSRHAVAHNSWAPAPQNFNGGARAAPPKSTPMVNAVRVRRHQFVLTSHNCTDV